MKKQHIIISIAAGLCLLLAIAAWGGFRFYQMRYVSAIDEGKWLYIDSDDNRDSLLARLSTIIDTEMIQVVKMACRHENTFDRVDARRSVGAYFLHTGSTPTEIARRIKTGLQTPVSLTFNNIRTKEELCRRVAQQLMVDSAALHRSLSDPELCHAIAESDTTNITSIFFPDTYEVYWTTSPEELMKRMKREYDRFWTPERLTKVQKLKITPQEASIIASIAEEETQDRAERGVVARLYWNRIQRRMPLQADPTVKYALGDFSITRVLTSHLQIKSPYNTYRVQGLPPGPIRIAEKATIDALLNSAPHPYIYMCAKEDFSGRHNFATTLAQHNRNAQRYHAALNRLNRQKKNGK